MSKINKKILSLLLLLTLTIPTQAAARLGVAEPTYAQALHQALHRSPDLVPVERELRQIVVAIREADDMRISHINDNKALSDFYESEYKRLNIEQERLRLERDRVRLSVEHSLRGYLGARSGLTADIGLLQESIAFRETLLEQAELRHRLGLASQLEVTEAQRTAEESRLNLEMLQLQLANTNQNLSLLLNRHIGAVVAVEYEHLDLPPVPDALMRPQFVEAQTNRHPNFVIAALEAERARFDWQRQIDAPEVDNTLTRLNWELSVMTRDETRRQAEASVLAALANWDRLQEERANLDTALEQARQEREIMLSRLEAGFVTQVQADASLLAVRATEIAVEKWYYDVWQARIRVDHPYMR